MSNKCFITKYQSAVDNDSLPRYGEVGFTAKALDSVNGSLTLSNGSAPISIRFDNPVINYQGNSVTEYNLPSGGNVQIRVPKGTTVKGYLKSKYNLTRISTDNVLDGGQLSDFTINIDDLKYSNINVLLINSGNTYGDLSSLSEKTSLKQLTLTSTKVTGTLSDIAGLTSLTYLTLTNTKVTGTLSDIAGLTSLTHLALANTKVTGTLSDIAGLTSLTHLALTNTKVTGTLSDIAGLTSLTYLALAGTKVTGTIEDFVVKQRANGRESGTITCPFGFSQVTFDGTRLMGTISLKVSWDATTITASNTNSGDKTITA